MIKLNIGRLRSLLWFHLKALRVTGDMLASDTLEYIMCESFDLKHVGKSNDYADGYKDRVQASIKTLGLRPTVLKKLDSRDFQTHPAKFLGPQHNITQQKHTAGLEIVQRRQSVNLDDAVASPQAIGEATLAGFSANIGESYTKYGTDKSYEIVAVHGHDYTNNNYLMNVYWQEYTPLDPSKITWAREGQGISGYSMNNDISYKVAERVNGNSSRMSTCFKEFKDVRQYLNKAEDISLPLPEAHVFDEYQMLNEIESAEADMYFKSTPGLFDS